MSKTALIWLTAYGTGAVFAFASPVYGLYAYFLDYYAHPPLRWWGKELPDLRWSFIIAIVTLVAFVIRRTDLPQRTARRHPQTKWLVLLMVNVFLVDRFLAVWDEKSWEQLMDLFKFAVLYFIIIAVVRTPKHFRYLILAQILGVTYWGWNAFSNPKREAGRLVNIGGPDSLNDNGAASIIVAILPLIAVVLLTGKRWEKLACLLAVPFVFNAFILCNSRGAFVALVVVAVAALLMTKGAVRWKLVLGLAIGAIVFVSLMDPEFKARQQTTVSDKMDTSSSNRILLWKGAVQLTRDHPFGTGGGGFLFLSPTYAPEVVEASGGRRAVHNTYLLGAADWGVPGLVFFMGFLIATILELHRLRRDPPLTPEEKTMHIQSLGIELGLIGLMVVGIFASRFYAEAVYWFPAFTAALRNLHADQRREAADQNQALAN